MIWHVLACVAMALMVLSCVVQFTAWMGEGTAGALFRELAQEFGISLRHAQNIIAGRKWRASCG